MIENKSVSCESAIIGNPRCKKSPKKCISSCDSSWCKASKTLRVSPLTDKEQQSPKMVVSIHAALLDIPCLPDGHRAQMRSAEGPADWMRGLVVESQLERRTHFTAFSVHGLAANLRDFSLPRLQPWPRRSCCICMGVNPLRPNTLGSHLKSNVQKNVMAGKGESNRVADGQRRLTVWLPDEDREKKMGCLGGFHHSLLAGY